MKEAIIIHGGPGKEVFFDESIPPPSHSFWFPWLQKQFLVNGILAQAPVMPAPYDSKFSEWAEIFDRFASPNLAYAVGHSSGGGFLVKYMQTSGLRLEKLILVAPWLDPKKNFGEEWQTSLDPRALDNVIETHLLISDDDDTAELESARRLVDAYPKIIEHRFQNRGHFIFINELPELKPIIFGKGRLDGK